MTPNITYQYSATMEFVRGWDWQAAPQCAIFLDKELVGNIKALYIGRDRWRYEIDFSPAPAHLNLHWRNGWEPTLEAAIVGVELAVAEAFRKRTMGGKHCEQA